MSSLASKASLISMEFDSRKLTCRTHDEKFCSGHVPIKTIMKVEGLLRVGEWVSSSES